jgi:hypothetical protein
MPEALGLEFESPTGDALSFQWLPGAFAQLDASAPPSEPVWTLGGELDWDEIGSVRVLSARLGDGRLLAVVALRPAGAEGHGDDLVVGAIGDGEAFATVDQPLLSTEYDAAGQPRRVGLELYPGEDGLALRIAADVTAATTSASGGVERVAAALAVRSPGGEGAGVVDLLTRA